MCFTQVHNLAQVAVKPQLLAHSRLIPRVCAQYATHCEFTTQNMLHVPVKLHLLAHSCLMPTVCAQYATRCEL